MKLYIYAVIHEHEQITTEVLKYEMDDAYPAWVLVEELEIATPKHNLDWTTERLRVLQSTKTTTLAKNEQRLQAIDEQIQQLLALPNLGAV